MRAWGKALFALMLCFVLGGCSLFSPVRELLYVGPATERKLHAYGIQTIGQLAQASDAYLKRRFGKIGFT